MLKGSVDDRTLAFHHGLVFQRYVAADLAVESSIVGFALPLPGFFDVSAMITFLLGRFGIDGEPHLLTVGIIDGQNPDGLVNRHFEAIAFLVPRFSGFAVDAGKHGAALSTCTVFGFDPRRDNIDFDAVFSLHRFEYRTLFVNAVEISHVGCVRGILRALKPVAAVTLAESSIATFRDPIPVHHQDIISR